MMISQILQYWRTIVTLAAPVLLCPLVFYVGTQEAKCGFVILVMAVYWVTECVPLPVTALLPIVLLPLFKILSTNDVCITYFKESNMMFIGKICLDCYPTSHLPRISDCCYLCGEVCSTSENSSESSDHHRHQSQAAHAGADATHHVPQHVDLQHRHHLHDGAHC